MSDWSSDVCSSDLRGDQIDGAKAVRTALNALPRNRATTVEERDAARAEAMQIDISDAAKQHAAGAFDACSSVGDRAIDKTYDYRYSRSEEHTSELQSLMRISYAVFCLKKKNTHKVNKQPHNKKSTHR